MIKSIIYLKRREGTGKFIQTITGYIFSFLGTLGRIKSPTIFCYVQAMIIFVVYWLSRYHTAILFGSWIRFPNMSHCEFVDDHVFA